MIDASPLIHQLLEKRLPLQTAMSRLIDAHAKVMPHPDWDRFRGLDFESETARLQEQWLDPLLLKSAGQSARTRIGLWPLPDRDPTADVAPTSGVRVECGQEYDMTKQQILEEARSLPSVDRIDLVMELWDTIDPSELDMTPELREELDRRLAADKADESPGQPWSVLREQLLRGEF